MASWSSPMEGLRSCHRWASRVNPDSSHRRELRRLMRWHELDIIEAVLLVDRIAQLDPSRGPMDITALVRDARAAIAPLWEKVAS